MVAKAHYAPAISVQEKYTTDRHSKELTIKVKPEETANQHTQYGTAEQPNNEHYQYVSSVLPVGSSIKRAIIKVSFCDPDPPDLSLSSSEEDKHFSTESDYNYRPKWNENFSMHLDK